MSPRPSLFESVDSVESNGKASSKSSTPSLSSSRSATSPVPSKSLSAYSLLSSGKASDESATPSSSLSGSALLPIPSPSVSRYSVGSNGKVSKVSSTPSLSLSVTMSRVPGTVDLPEDFPPQQTTPVSSIAQAWSFAAHT